MRKKVGIYEAKTHLSKILRAVRKNKVSFEITERGVPLAILSPIEENSAPISLDQRISELEMQGIVSIAKHPNIPGILKKSPGALKRFLDDRE